MPGQLRKTIDRISTGTMKRLIFSRMLGIKHEFVVHPTPSSTSTHPKFILAAVWKETLKGNWHEKSRNPRSYRPKLKLQFFEKKQRKENGMRKVGIQDLTAQSWNCCFLKRNNERKMGWEEKESTILPFKVQSCRFLNRKLPKEKESRKV